jgi:outer membrane murein-binding lipoprotein Lpp
MAQTKTKSKSNARRSGSSSRGGRSSSTKSNGSGGSGAKVKASGAKASQAKAKASQKANGAANGVADSVKHGAEGVGPLVRKAKVPLLASGAALVGVAGAVAATAHSKKRHRVLGVSMPKANGMKPDAKKISEAVVDIAKRADQLGQGVSRVASSVQGVGETANKAAKKA